MFGKKAAKIKELTEHANRLDSERLQLIREKHELRSKNEELVYENSELREELFMIKPVFMTPGFKPAMTKRCERCKFAYFSDYNSDEMLGCAKDVVCEDFVDMSRRE